MAAQSLGVQRVISEDALHRALQRRSQYRPVGDDPFILASGRDKVSAEQALSEGRADLDIMVAIDR